MHNKPPVEPTFIRQERRFAAHIRHPALNPKPEDVETRRMAIYNELFFNNVQGFLAASFPVLRRISADDHWRQLVRDFYAEHPCRNPLFSRLAEEFLSYLQRERRATAEDLPFLAELAHYEWVELALSLSDADEGLPAFDPNGDLLTGHPLISPLAWRFSYRYPVHRIGPDYRPGSPPQEATHLLIYRDRQDRIGFLEINPVTLALLDLLESEPTLSGRDAIEALVQTLNHPDPDTVMQAGIDLLNDLRRRDILLGVTV
jgi:hypothetical protein